MKQKKSNDSNTLNKKLDRAYKIVRYSNGYVIALIILAIAVGVVFAATDYNLDLSLKVPNVILFLGAICLAVSACGIIRAAYYKKKIQESDNKKTAEKPNARKHQ